MLDARLDFLRDVLEVESSQKVSEALWPQCNIRQNQVYVFAKGFSLDSYGGRSGMNMNCCRGLITKFEFMIETSNPSILDPDFIAISMPTPENMQ